MNALSQREKSVELVNVSTRVLMTSRTVPCANCDTEVKLSDRHKYVSAIHPQTDADDPFDESVLCDADCVSDFV
jgi:hypothetical protein